MASNIHPTAIIESGAQLGADVVIGAYAYVGPEVVLGDRCVLHHHATVEGFTTLGRECELYPFTCIGTKTQDLKYRGGRPGTRIGDRNIFREYTSVHGATKDGEFTVLGDTVNVASRLEHLTRALGARAVVSEAVVAAARHEGADLDGLLRGFRDLGVQAVRGRAEGIRVWALTEESAG